MRKHIRPGFWWFLDSKCWWNRRFFELFYQFRSFWRNSLWSYCKSGIFISKNTKFVGVLIGGIGKRSRKQYLNIIQWISKSEIMKISKNIIILQFWHTILKNRMCMPILCRMLYASYIWGQLWFCKNRIIC